MLFVIIGRDSPNAKELRPKVRPAHLAHLAPLDQQGRVKLAGPLTDGVGSLFVVDLDSLDEAWALIGTDPYSTSGVFESVEVHPFTQVLPATG